MFGIQGGPERRSTFSLSLSLSSLSLSNTHTNTNTQVHCKIPLLSACSYGFIEVFNLLIENGADVNMCNSKAWTPLHCASRSGHLDITKALLYRGAQTDAENVHLLHY